MSDQFRGLTDDLLPHIVSGPRPYIIAVDGRSGSGKTTLARRLAATLRQHPAQGGPLTVLELSLENMYPGWDGLKAGVEQWGRLSASLAKHTPGSYTPWDWEQNRPAPPVTVLPDAAPVIVCEGVGALCGAFSYGVLVLAGTGVRYERAMARDGETYRPYWNMWAAQEEQLFEDYGSYYITSPGWAEGPNWVYRTG